MAKGSKLLKALDRNKGKDYKLEHQKKLRKQAEKRKRTREAEEIVDEEDSEEDSNDEEGGVKVNGSSGGSKADGPEWETEDEEDEDDDADKAITALSRLADSDSDSSDDDDDEEEEEEEEEDPEADDIPLSDIESLASDEKGDIIPHQRLTINNTAALLAAVNRISLQTSKIPFSEHQSITSAAPIEIPDVEDDLNRELAFYKQSLEAVKEARALLKAEGVPFSRPTDYFAEMVKSDEHMGKIKQKLIDEAAGKKAAAEARRQRDLKKFGKQVQVAKLQERDRAKRETIDRINTLKRKRQGAAISSTNEGGDGDMFDVSLDNDAPSKHREQSGKPNAKRQKKNEKFGFGGKKRFAKSGDAMSSADMRGFSVKKMKAGSKPKTGGSKRLGKSKRAKKF